jgi:hypothetical protein
MFMWSKEYKIRAEIKRNALKLAEEQYRKDVAFRSLQSTDLHYAIIQDLMQAARLTGRVTIKLADGTEIKIESKDDRDDLNDKSRELF